jgi:hypothetical protein
MTIINKKGNNNKNPLPDLMHIIRTSISIIIDNQSTVNCLRMMMMMINNGVEGWERG